MKEKIEKRIAKLEGDRDEFVKQANMEVAAMNGAIQELKSLLAPDNEEANEGEE